MNCPNCSSRVTGRVGSERFYCWDCCVEFNVTRAGDLRIYRLNQDGDLISAAPQAAPGPVADQLLGDPGGA